MHVVQWIVRGRQRMHRATKGSHVERGYVLVSVDHRRGEVRGEVRDATYGLRHGVPAAHRVEDGVADPLHPALFAHPGVERVGVLQGVGAEEIDGVHREGHDQRVIAQYTRVNGMPAM